MANIIYIATSIDGYIAKSDGGIDWLISLPNPEHSDYGFADFMNRIDGVLMGRNTYETVMNFDEWAYTKPLFVLTSSLNELPGKWAHKAEIIKGDIKEVIAILNAKGINDIYIDGGKTIQSFLAADRIDEMVITQVPILLGSGIPLFNNNNPELQFEHADTTVYKNGLVKNSYIRKR